MGARLDRAGTPGVVGRSCCEGPRQAWRMCMCLCWLCVQHSEEWTRVTPTVVAVQVELLGTRLGQNLKTSSPPKSETLTQLSSRCRAAVSRRVAVSRHYVVTLRRAHRAPSGADEACTAAADYRVSCYCEVRVTGRQRQCRVGHSRRLHRAGGGAPAPLVRAGIVAPNNSVHGTKSPCTPEPWRQVDRRCVARCICMYPCAPAERSAPRSVQVAHAANAITDTSPSHRRCVC